MPKTNEGKLFDMLKKYLAMKEFNVNRELEVKFGTKGFRQITRIDYENVIQKLKSTGFVETPISNFLRIQNEFLDAKRGETTLSNIRTEIKGVTQIQDYCKTNTLVTDDENETVKKNISFEQKYIAKVDDKPIYPINYDDFNFRISLSKEKQIQPQSGFIKGILSKWSETRKVFRLISRTSFMNPDFPVKVDCSIVQSSKKEHRKFVPAYTIKESNVLTEPYTFEIEIELMNDFVEKDKLTFDQIANYLRRVIKIVLSGLQQTNYPIGYEEQDEVLMEYMDMVHNRKKDKDKKKRSKTEEEEIRKKYNERVFPKNFIGPSSYTLQLENITPSASTNGVVSVREPYTVTEKADGLRKMLYISHEGKIYLIDMNMNVQFTGAIVREKTLFKTLMDGEHITTNRLGQFINLYAAFDIYFVNNLDMRKKALVNVEEDAEENNYRLPILKNVIKAMNHVSIVDKSLSPIRIEAKKFYVSKTGGEESTIFKACNKILTKIDSEMFEYETDGLIFTPINTGVGTTSLKQDPANYKVTWDLSFKWKPPQYNTIDFLISTKKDKDGKETVKTLFEEGTSTTKTTEVTMYKILTLRVGFDEKRHGYINPMLDLINEVEHKYNSAEDRNTYKPLPFYPTNPYDPNASICNIIIEKDVNGIDQMFTEDKTETFRDNEIVEFRYEKTNDVGWRWIPIRVRHDKTDEFKKGGKNFGNAYHVAESNWKSIHNPITEEMLKTGEGIPIETPDYNVYYNRTTSKSNTKPLRDFHNLVVKKNLITGVSKRGDTLIDFAVGKGGDLPKWIASKLDFVFGIDVSRDNIENRLDGACARYLNMKKRTKIMPSALFVNGNSGVNIRNTDAMFSEQGKKITNAVFGEGPKDEAGLGKAVYKQYGKAKKGFNIASCQFAIHYFFESPATLKEFLRNVTECLSVDGYFIGTCYDGEKLFHMLKKREKGQGIMINLNETKICEITKQYDRDDFADDLTSVGYPIDVYQETINKTFREYLVNFSYLTRVMENYGLVPVKREECKKMGIPNSSGSFSDLFAKMERLVGQKRLQTADIGSAMDMTSQEKQISFLNRYFVFKKVREVDAESVTLDVKGFKDLEVVDKKTSDEEVSEDKDEGDKKDDKKDDKKKVKSTKKKLVLKTKKSDKEEDKPEKDDEEKVESIDKDETIIEKGRPVEKFWSKSKEDKKDKFGTGYSDWQKRLSNFWEGDIDDDNELVIDGATWPTIEHWFQANKFMFSGDDKYKYYVDQFKKGGKFDIDEGKGKGAYARKAGGKTATKKAKVPIDPEWDTKSYNVLMKGIAHKIELFPDIKKILQVLKENNVYIVHYESSRGKEVSKWGASVKKQKDGTHKIIGRNWLGNIYMTFMKKM